MEGQRLGRQTPTTSVILPYTKTYGAEAVSLYNKTGRTAQEWQELLLYDILAVEEDTGLYVHSKFGYAVPRRNGKNEVVSMRELWGLLKGEKILHTAHRVTTSHSAFERLLTLLNAAGYQEKEDFKPLKQLGLETIEMLDGSGGKISFRTRTSKGGLGEGFDLLIIDEAQEYQDDQETALKYVVSDSRNPQTIFCGTPPTVVSTGTVFTKLRNKTLQSGALNTGWTEWSVEHMTDPHDKEAWYETNPSLGTILTERKIMDEIGDDETDFNIQRLGLWIRYNQKSAISEKEWNALKVEQMPKLKSRIFVGIKYGHTGENVALSIAVKTAEDNIFVECIDCRPVRAGNTWIIDFLRAADIQEVVVDGANGQALLQEEIKDYQLKLKPLLPTVKQVIEANATFEQGLFQQNIQHAGQPSLCNVVSNCEKRAIGSNGGFGYKTIQEGLESALLDSIIYAYWACSKAKKQKVKQRISY